MLRGQAVWNLTLMFLMMWQFTTTVEADFDRYRPTMNLPSDGFVQPFGDSPLDNLNVSETAYMQIINRAHDYVYITTPYLILDNEMGHFAHQRRPERNRCAHHHAPCGG